MRRYADRIADHPKHETIPGYWARHEAAVRTPLGAEGPIVALLRGWLFYADRHRERFDSGIGQDGVLGPEWARIGAAIRGLLNGELGRLDGGAVDALICNTLHTEGYNPDTEDWEK